ncbi:MAG: hypothetical protein HY392_00755 [Candidatus Diapherotrites archaeon]|nr:hypothetical protein [Candidatus Diapherotrites archaeon]
MLFLLSGDFFLAKKKKSKSVRSRSTSDRARKQVQDMIEDMREAGMILSGVARHFHHRVRSASHLLLKRHSNKKSSSRKRHGRAKRRR